MYENLRHFRLPWLSLALAAALGLTAQGLRAQGEDPVPLRNWPAPLAWQATTAAETSIQHESRNHEPQPSLTTSGGSAQLAMLVAITPCRLIDTRVGHDPGSLTGWPVGSTNTINAVADYGESCGTSLPVAQAYSANITVRMSYGGGTLGFVTVWPTGTSMPSTSALNNIAGLLTVNSAAVIPATIGGTVSPFAQFNVFLSSNGTATKVDVIIDVNGYYISPDSLQLGKGSFVAPSLTFGADATTGLWSPGTGVLAMAAGGANIASVTSTGFSVNGNLDFSGTITQSGQDLVQSSAGNQSLAAGITANLQGTGNAAFGYGALGSANSGIQNVAVGTNAATNNSGSGNVALGFGALFMNTSGNSNTALRNHAIGSGLGFPGPVGNASTGVGDHALSNNTGNNNTGIGASALSNVTSGHDNVAIGLDAGMNISNGANDIYIGNPGTFDESTTIRVGVQGTQNATYIAGIYGVNSGGSTQSVVINSSGQLGSVSSSRRFKQDIRDLAETTDTLMALRPVRFRYKVNAPDGPENFGLVAEEVNEIAPELVGHDRDGQVDSVAYDKVYTMMLAELQKQHRFIEAQSGQLQEQRRVIEALELRLADLENKR